MHDVLVVDPLSHFLQQPVMPDIVKVGSQIKVEDPRLPLSYCFSHSLDRVVCCPDMFDLQPPRHISTLRVSSGAPCSHEGPLTGPTAGRHPPMPELCRQSIEYGREWT